MLYGISHISIHAAREGGDEQHKGMFTTDRAFQSTPPVKAATHSPLSCGFALKFQSTPPVKAATS